MQIRKPGDTVEGFRVLSELGRGAASVIYLVQDVKSKQVWALKHVIRETAKDQRFLDQAEQEYQVASRMNHPAVRSISRIIKKKPNLLTVTELYLVMELVDGASMDVAPPNTFEDAVYVFEQIASALEAMHKTGFVHADMKPNNVVIDDKLQVRIIDLGQSCKIGAVKERIQGTPDYIAPEQVHRREITPKTDVYNLGAMMYWAITRSKIPTALAKATSLIGSVEDHLIEKPKRTIELNARTPELLDKVIMECVEVRPEDRPDMSQVRDRLNLIRGKLVAEQEMRRSGMMPSADPAGSRAGGGEDAEQGGV